MKTSITNDILSILNSSLSNSEKRNAIREMQSRRRGENRQLLIVVIDMLSSHILPLRFKESINRYCFNNISEKNYDKLKYILEHSNYTFFNAICSELLWMHYHDIKFAEQAIHSYNLEIQNFVKNDETKYTQLVLSICRIYSKCKICSFSYDSFFENTIKYIQTNKNSTNYCNSFMLTGLLACQENLQKIEETYDELILNYEETNNLNIAIGYLEDLEKLYRNQKEIVKLKETQIHIAKNYETLSEQYDWNNPADSHRIINLIHKSMNAWDRAKDKKTITERKRLAQKIEPVKKQSLKALQLIKSSPLDITKEIELIKDSINHSSFELVIYRLAEFTPLKTPKELRESANKYIFSSLFPTTVLNSEGRIKYIIPAINNDANDDTPLLEHRACEEYSLLSRTLIQNYILLAKEKYDFTEENLQFLVNNNAFIRPERKNSFLKGLVAGFNLDLVTALHLLMPQVEYSFRCLAQDCGAVVFKTDSEGVEECFSLKGILDMPEVIECLDETFLFNLRLFYVSDYGYGMRDSISHGLYSDNELQSPQGLAVWWFTLRICCMFSSELKKRLIDQSKAKEKPSN